VGNRGIALTKKNLHGGVLAEIIASEI